jgi:hypothetical protein
MSLCRTSSRTTTDPALTRVSVPAQLSPTTHVDEIGLNGVRL